MAEFDNFTSEYSTMLNESLSLLGGFDDYYLQRKVDILKDIVSKKNINSILDFGCGLGKTTFILKNAFPNAIVVGADISGDSIKEAKKQYSNIEFRSIEDVLSEPKYKGLFDAIYIANVFHHIPIKDREEVMLNIKNMLSPNGNIFLFEHNPFNPLTNWVVSRCEFDKDAILLNPNETKYLFEKVGLTVDKIRFFLFFPHKLKKFAKIEKLFARIPLGAQYYLMASLKK